MNILVLENGGSILTGAVLCVSVALVTSGIEMRDIPIACTVVSGFPIKGSPFNHCNISSSHIVDKHSYVTPHLMKNIILQKPHT